jgi:hypothetical protein
VYTIFHVVFDLLLDFKKSLLKKNFFCCYNKRGQDFTIFFVIIFEVKIITISIM